MEVAPAIGKSCRYPSFPVALKLNSNTSASNYIPALHRMEPYIRSFATCASTPKATGVNGSTIISPATIAIWSMIDHVVISGGRDLGSIVQTSYRTFEPLTLNLSVLHSTQY